MYIPFEDSIFCKNGINLIVNVFGKERDQLYEENYFTELWSLFFVMNKLIRTRKTIVCVRENELSFY